MYYYPACSVIVHTSVYLFNPSFNYRHTQTKSILPLCGHSFGELEANYYAIVNHCTVLARGRMLCPWYKQKACLTHK